MTDREVVTRYMRTCQECGHQQMDKDPHGGMPTVAFNERKCKRCKSPALDYGSNRDYDATTGEEILFDEDDQK